MIDHVELKDFKGHRHTRVPLGRLTLLVGDNASGKTSVLDALALLASMSPAPVSALIGEQSPGDLLRRGSAGPIVLATRGAAAGAASQLVVSIAQDKKPGSTEVIWNLRLQGVFRGQGFGTQGSVTGAGGSSAGGWENIALVLGTAKLYLLRADRIAAAAYSAEPEATVEVDGTNTAVALAAMKLGNDEAFDRVEQAMRKLIPSLQRIRIQRALVSTGHQAVSGNKIVFDFRGAPGVPAHCASHGTLVVLALLTILHGPRRPNLILLDDLDHALHPRAQIELIRMLKVLLELPDFADVQIVATTHSPYILDELEPSQIHAFALRDDGTVATKPLSAHPDASGTGAKLTSGQLWSLDPERDWVLRE